MNNKETIEETAENYSQKYSQKVGRKYGFMDGAEYQAERMYSEDEVQVKLYECLGHFAQKHNIIINGNEIDQWFNQFKNK